MELTADDIGVIRRLVEWGRANGYQHHTVTLDGAVTEHIWSDRNRANEVFWMEGRLAYRAHGVLRFSVLNPSAQGAQAHLAIEGVGQ